MKLWIVGKYIMEAEKGRAWEIMSVYDSEELAIKNCKDEYCFIGPVLLNDPSSLEQKDWEGSYYPKVSDAS
ncbi:hypothetical protein KAR91_33960 [Candidatus Pacearchaeota archaeon]|nr:hypothetical protein [Candidatus Pacearchaeota archaeon]